MDNNKYRVGNGKRNSFLVIINKKTDWKLFVQPKLINMKIKEFYIVWNCSCKIIWISLNMLYRYDKVLVLDLDHCTLCAVFTGTWGNTTGSRNNCLFNLNRTSFDILLSKWRSFTDYLHFFMGEVSNKTGSLLRITAQDTCRVFIEVLHHTELKKTKNIKKCYSENRCIYCD